METSELLRIVLYAEIGAGMLLIAGLFTALTGILIGQPTLRLRGDYLAIVTLGLGEIVSIITASKWAQPLVGGPQGIRGVSKAEIFGLNPHIRSVVDRYASFGYRAVRGMAAGLGAELTLSS